MKIVTIGDLRVLAVGASGTELGSERSAIDLIGETYGQEIDVIAIPLERLTPMFLSLKTGVAGHFLQKFINYGFRVAIIGEIPADALASKALRDFVTESNRAKQVRFAATLEALKDPT
ncbi:MAG TPA: DUF4180 domain-containing protein [Devosia sp.]|nr:DUF4180 domain-containing protein [Devosia sp.]